MSILPSPSVRLPQEGEVVRRVERESERQESGRHDMPDRHPRHGSPDDEQQPDVEVDVSEEYVAEHAVHEDLPVSEASPGDEPPVAHHIDIEA